MKKSTERKNQYYMQLTHKYTHEKREKINLLVEKMIIYFQLAVSSKIIWQEHYWNVNMTKFIYL